jgi:hypothetical protein
MQHVLATFAGWLVANWLLRLAAAMFSHLGDADGADLHRLAALHDVHGRVADGSRPQVLQQVARLQQECMPSATTGAHWPFNSCSPLRCLQQSECTLIPYFGAGRPCPE